MSWELKCTERCNDSDEGFTPLVFASVATCSKGNMKIGISVVHSPHTRGDTALCISSGGGWKGSAFSLRVFLRGFLGGFCMFEAMVQSRDERF